MPSGHTAKRQAGVRADKMRDKRQRIQTAARQLFSRRGYDEASLREIAARADVGLGTLFHYAHDKRDLVFLIFNEELAAVIHDGLLAPRDGQPIVEQLLEVFATHYHFYKKDVALARILMRELIFYSEGMHSAEFLGNRRKLLIGLRRLIRTAQAEGQLCSDEDPRAIAQLIFFIFAAQIRWWIAGSNPEVSAGLNDLRRLLRMMIGGVGPKSVGAKRRHRSR
jgi:AcrR family transcriptional regulator